MRYRLLWGGAALCIVAILSFPLLQTIPNGSQHYYMIDVGETQIVLNTWGTLHATGYPLYVMTGSALNGLFRAAGVSAAAAPAWVSFVWGIAALACVYALCWRIVRAAWIAAGVTLIFALTRTVWIHLVIAEIYTFTLLFLALLLWLAAGDRDDQRRERGNTEKDREKQGGGDDQHRERGDTEKDREKQGNAGIQPSASLRLYALALIGGIAVAHHRALAFAAPALIVVMARDLIADRRLGGIVRRVIVCLALGLLGFLPYLYLPARAAVDAGWVYGDPRTLDGFLDQFLGREASRFIGAPSSWEGLRANLELVMNVLITDVGIVGIAAGISGLIIGVFARETRRAAILLAGTGGAAFAFHVIAYTDVLSALILMVTLALAGGWAWLARRLAAMPIFDGRRWIAAVGTLIAAGLAAISLYAHNAPFIESLTRDPAGLDAIQLARRVPPDTTLMLPWGVHHAAVGFARDVSGELRGFTLIDHNGDMTTGTDRPLVTFDYTRYAHGADWWRARIGDAFHPRALAPHIVQVNAPPRQIDVADVTDAIAAVDARVVCSDAEIALSVGWVARTPLTESLRVFVHGVDAAGNVIAQADQEAPVYGWSPTNTWRAGVIVEDSYAIARTAAIIAVRYGLYRIIDGGFENVIAREMTTACGGES
jgi:hypothetical protein